MVEDAARAVGMSVGGGYALRRTSRGYAFNLGWEAALIIARRIVADRLMTAAIKGEEARWVREESVTTYTRQNTKAVVGAARQGQSGNDACRSHGGPRRGLTIFCR